VRRAVCAVSAAPRKGGKSNLCPCKETAQ